MRTKLKINHARSMNNGIRFYSRRHKGYVAISTVNEFGNINTEWTTMKKYKKERNKDDKIADKKKIAIFVLGTLPFVTIFVLLFDWITIKNAMLGMRFYLAGYVFMLVSLFLITTCIERRKEKSSYRFHAAEHMALNAYRKLKRVPTLEEIHKFPRFHNSCGTNEITFIVMTFSLMLFCTFIHNDLYRVIGMISVNVIVFLLLRCGLLNFLQNVTTITPTDIELKVAISGMNVWFENEKKEKEKSSVLKFFQRLFSKSFY